MKQHCNKKTIASRFSVALLAAALSTATWALEPVNPNLIQIGKDTLNYLEQQHIAGKTISGADTGARYPNSYQSVGRRAAHWMFDLSYFSNSKVDLVISDWQKYRPIITLMWHWNLDGRGFSRSGFPADFTIKQVTTPGGLYYNDMIADMDRIAGYLQRFEDAGVAVIFRPLHENGGGWFWWADGKDKAGCAEHWQILYNYLTHTKGLNNLIWEYNIGQGLGMDISNRKPFYPGDAYCDFISVDVYDTDHEVGGDQQWWYWNYMQQITPNKMIGCGEGAKIQNPDYMAEGLMPPWLTSMPWYGCPMGTYNTIRWARYTFSHPQVITLDELPRFGTGNLYPEVGVIGPEWQTWTYDADPVLKVFARDRDGSISKVEFFAENALNNSKQSLGVVTSGSNNVYTLTWNNMPSGFYRITATATDNSGQLSDSDSNGVSWIGGDGWRSFAWITKGFYNIARNKSVTASSEASPAKNAVNGDYETGWSAVKNSSSPLSNNAAWFQVDLGANTSISQVNVRWNKTCFADSFRIDVSSNGSDWSTAYSITGYRPITDTGPVTFCPFPNGAVTTRYIRLVCTKMSSNNYLFYGYGIVELEVPIAMSAIPANIPRTLELHNHRAFWEKKFERTVFGTPGSVKDTGSNYTYREDYFDAVGEQLCSRIEFDTGTGSFSLQPYDDTARDMSAFSNGHLHFWARSNVAQNYNLQVQDNSGLHTIRTLNLTSAWQRFVVPVSQITTNGVNLASVKAPFIIAKSGNNGSTLYLSEVYWSSVPPLQPSANIVTDSSFDATNAAFPTTQIVYQGDADRGWIAGALGNFLPIWKRDATNHLAAVGSKPTNAARRLVQVIADRRATTGERQFTFHAKSVENVTPTNALTVAVFGINQDRFSMDLVFGSTNGPVDLLGPVGTLLTSHEILGNFDGDVSKVIDFGVGYDEILILFFSKNVDPTHGDTFWIDDVCLTPLLKKGYEVWSTLYDWPNTGVDDAPNADPNGDGIPNLLAYACALPPLGPNSQRIFSEVAVPQTLGAFRFLFRRATGGAEGISYAFDFSTDLANWTPVDFNQSGNLFLPLNDDPDGDGSAEHVEVAISTIGLSHGFVRLRIVAD